MENNLKQGLKIQLPTEILILPETKVYKKLHSCDLLERRLEDLRRIVGEKYSCDYLGVHFFNNRSDMFFSNICHDRWHDYYWGNFMNDCPTLKISSQLKKGENGFLFFFDYKNKGMEVRAEIIGEEKEGFTIMFHNDNNFNKIQFTLTFKDGKNISSFDAATFNELLKDLKSLESVIDDFMEYFDKVGELKDGKNLEDFIRSKKYTFPLLK